MLILTADIGEGHDLPARIIKADLEEEVPGAEVEIANGLDAMGKICAAVLRNGSKVTFRWMPWLFDIQYWLITKFAPTRWLFHHIGYLIGGRGLMRLIAEHDPDTVISTYPGVTAVLGMLRENRRLEIPVQSAITDLAGLRYWAHPGVDLHYVTHPESIEEVERLVGPGHGRVGAPADLPRVPDAAHPPRRPRGARRAGPRAGRARLRRRLGDRRPRGRDPLGALRRRHPGGLHHRPQRGRPREAGEALRRATSRSASSASPSR